MQFTQQQGEHDRVVEKGEVIRISAHNLLEYTSFPTQMGLKDDLENYILICYELLDNYDGTTQTYIHVLLDRLQMSVTVYFLCEGTADDVKKNHYIIL